MWNGEIELQQQGYLEIDDIDLVKTAENVDNFLNHGLERAVRVVNINITDLQSPSLDGLPKAPNFSNTFEDKMVQYIDSRNLVEGFKRVYPNCNIITQKIIKCLYLQGMSNQAMMQLLDYEHSRYADIKRNALNEFADRYEMQPGCPDLHVRKNRKHSGKISGTDR